MNPKSGRVSFVGLGPGPLGCMTLQARERLATADVVVFGLVGEQRWVQWLKPTCERVYVGPREGAPALQPEEVEQLLIGRARGGRRVVRLFPGDPLLFSRGAEEARSVAAAGLAIEVVPGVSAAQAAGAFAGLPWHTDDVRSPVTIVSGTDPVGVEWAALAASGATLAIYDPLPRMRAIVDALTAGGLAPQHPVALVEAAGTPQQRVVMCGLESAPHEAERADLASPVVLFAGWGARPRSRLDWFGRRPLSGRRLVVTRASEQAGEWRGRLEDLGAEVVELPLIEVRESVDAATARDVFAEFGGYDWMVFTSANGVRHFFAEFFRRFADIRSLGFVRLAAVGSRTAEALAAWHLKAELVPETATAAALGEALVATGSLDSAKVLVVQGSLSGDDLAATLETRGRAIVDRLRVYETRPTDLSGDVNAQDFRARGADAVIFASSSAVRAFVDQAEQLRLSAGAQRPLFASLGPITAGQLREFRLPVDVEAPDANLDALVEALAARWTPGLQE